MENFKKDQTMNTSRSNLQDKTEGVSNAANDLLKEGKKFASAIYEEGRNQVSGVEDNVKEYSDQILRSVQQNPLTSILVAGGIGFLLSTLIRK